MEKITRLCRNDFENIKAGQTVPFPLQDKTCLNRCRAMVAVANDNWVREDIEKFTSSFNRQFCVLSVTAVKKEN